MFRCRCEWKFKRCAIEGSRRFDGDVIDDDNQDWRQGKFKARQRTTPWSKRHGLGSR